jgi:hypothetical protein
MKENLILFVGIALILGLGVWAIMTSRRHAKPRRSSQPPPKPTTESAPEQNPGAPPSGQSEPAPLLPKSGGGAPIVRSAAAEAVEPELVH